MKKIEDSAIDLVVTSPPYDQLRKYEEYSFDLHKTGKEIFRILKGPFHEGPFFLLK